MYNVCKQRYTNENNLISYLILFCSELYIPLWVFKLYGYTMTCICMCGVPSENSNKMKNQKYHIVGTILKSNIKIVERGKIDIPSTQLHDRSLSWLATGTSIESGGVKITENRIETRYLTAMLYQINIIIYKSLSIFCLIFYLIVYSNWCHYPVHLGGYWLVN